MISLTANLVSNDFEDQVEKLMDNLNICMLNQNYCFNGYISATTGLISSQTSTKEVYTMPIPIEDLNSISYSLNENNTEQWIVIGAYGENDTFIGRYGIFNKFNYYDLTTLKNNDEIKYIKISYRTYGNDNLILLHFSSHLAMQKFYNYFNFSGVNNIFIKNNKLKTAYLINCLSDAIDVFNLSYEVTAVNDVRDITMQLNFNSDCYLLLGSKSIVLSDKSYEITQQNIGSRVLFAIIYDDTANEFKLVGYNILNSLNMDHIFIVFIFKISNSKFIATVNPIIQMYNSKQESLPSTITNQAEDIEYELNTAIYENGYINGVITSDGYGKLSTAGINNERTLPYFPINFTDKSIMKLAIHVNATGSEISNWVAIAIYDDNFNILTRPTPISDNSNNNIEKQITYDFPQTYPNAKYFRISYRSFRDDNHATFSLIFKPTHLITTIPTVFNYFKSKIDNYDSIMTVNNYDKLITNNIKTINHQGWYLAPRNTLPAYVLSKKWGFWACESDIRFTYDGTPVLLHDDTINSRARNADGSELESVVNIADITIEQAKEYDFGIYYSNKYAGTKIPTFEEWLNLCKMLNIHMYIELKTGSSNQIHSLVNLTRKYGMIRNCTWISFGDVLLNYVLEADEYARCGNLSMELSTAKIDWCYQYQTDKNELFTETAITTVTDQLVEYAIEKKVPIEVFSANSTNIFTAPQYITGYTCDSIIPTNLFIDKIYNDYNV